MPSTPGQLSPSSNLYLNAIQWGGWVWSDPNPDTDTTNITYYFGPSGQDLDSRIESGWGTSSSWLDYEKAAYRHALQTWANVADITFTEVFSSDQANLVEFVTRSATSDEDLGLHFTPEHALTLKAGLDAGWSAGWGVRL